MSWIPRTEFDYVKSKTLDERLEEVALSRRELGPNSLRVVAKCTDESKAGVDSALLATEKVFNVPDTTAMLRLKQLIRQHLSLPEDEFLFLVFHPLIAYVDQDSCNVRLGILQDVFGSEDHTLYVCYTFEDPVKKQQYYQLV